MSIGLFDADVKRAYRLVRECVQAFQRLRLEGVKIGEEWRETKYEATRPSKERAASYEKARSSVLDAAKESEKAMAVVRDRATGLWLEPVRVVMVHAPTFLEGALGFMRKRAEELPAGPELVLGSDDVTHPLLYMGIEWPDFDNTFKEAWIEAQLRIEEARLLAERSGGYSRVLKGLEGQSKRLMGFLIDRAGRTVTLQELWRDFWKERGNYDALPNRAHQAIWKLREDLVDLGFTDLKIDNVREEGYTLA